MPVVIFIALLSFTTWYLIGPEPQLSYALVSAMTVLVIACPCALGLATPISIMVGVGRAAEQGILIRDGEALQQAGRLTLVAVTDFQAHSGRGVSGQLNGQRVRLGNTAFMEENGIEVSEPGQHAEQLASQGETPVYLAVDQRIVGILSIADQVKEDTKDAIERLHKLGLQTVMLTGDNAQTAETVAMVGDGINDTPALARSDVGIAIGTGTGTDVAIESAAITLMRGSLHGVADAIGLSRATVRNIKQNLFGAFVYNTVGIPVAAGLLYPVMGLLLSPVIAAAALSMSSVTVVSNALRLRRVSL